MVSVIILLIKDLERELFGRWCNLIFRPEMPSAGNLLSNLVGGKTKNLPGNMQDFLACLQKVDQELLSTKGPWFFDIYDYPTMIDFVYVSHVERMLASCAYWKGLDIRDTKQWNLKGINAWLDAFEQREHYLAFKSDYYTHVKDIPPQYGPGYTGGIAEDQEQFASMIEGSDGKSWTLPLDHDDPLQPLYRGPPLPLCALEAVGINADSDGTYHTSGATEEMAQACRLMAAWKLSGNGPAVAKFAARGGPKGSQNNRKRFGAELADPYAESDESISSTVDNALRVICNAMATAKGPMPADEAAEQLRDTVPSNDAAAVIASLEYLRDRIGVPRDLPLASGRYLRAYLNWGITALQQ